MRDSRRITRWGGALLVCGLWLTALVRVSAGGAPTPAAGISAHAARFSEATADLTVQQSTSQSPQAPPAQATYVGSDTCIQCHDDQRKGFEGTPHGRATDWRTPASRQGCETCHGPGSLHIDDPAAHPVKIFRKLSADAVNATCATCHNRGEHALWENSQHESRNLSCISCHSVHSFKSPTGQLKAERQVDVCASCHRDKVAKLDRSGHMPVREGKMQCSTCHNPHGATNVKLLRKGDSIGELCTSCHADKRGPFLWEHPPGRDGCVTCHDPHGSSNERMLVSKPPILCQRCHVGTRHPSTIYDANVIGSATSPSVRIFARSCVLCHSAIHGSNHPSGQRFIR